jgi:hypothetical protein
LFLLSFLVLQVTTVGYGDVTPTTDSGKVFTIFYVLAGCALAAKSFRDIVCYPLLLKEKKNELRIIQQFGEELSERTLKRIINSDILRKHKHLQQDSSQITKSEFALLVLRMMDKIQEKDIILVSQIFDNLDVQKDGILSQEDQEAQIEIARQRDRERHAELQRRLAE